MWLRGCIIFSTVTFIMNLDPSSGMTLVAFEIDGELKEGVHHHQPKLNESTGLLFLIAAIAPYLLATYGISLADAQSKSRIFESSEEEMGQFVTSGFKRPFSLDGRREIMVQDLMVPNVLLVWQKRSRFLPQDSPASSCFLRAEGRRTFSSDDLTRNRIQKVPAETADLGEFKTRFEGIFTMKRYLPKNELDQLESKVPEARLFFQSDDPSQSGIPTKEGSHYQSVLSFLENENTEIDDLPSSHGLETVTMHVFFTPFGLDLVWASHIHARALSQRKSKRIGVQCASAVWPHRLIVNTGNRGDCFSYRPKPDFSIWIYKHLLRLAVEVESRPDKLDHNRLLVEGASAVRSANRAADNGQKFFISCIYVDKTWKEVSWHFVFEKSDGSVYSAVKVFNLTASVQALEFVRNLYNVRDCIIQEGALPNPKLQRNLLNYVQVLDNVPTIGSFTGALPSFPVSPAFPDLRRGRYRGGGGSGHGGSHGGSGPGSGPGGSSGEGPSDGFGGARGGGEDEPPFGFNKRKDGDYHDGGDNNERPQKRAQTERDHLEYPVDEVFSEEEDEFGMMVDKYKHVGEDSEEDDDSDVIFSLPQYEFTSSKGNRIFMGTAHDGTKVVAKRVTKSEGQLYDLLAALKGSSQFILHPLEITNTHSVNGDFIPDDIFIFPRCVSVADMLDYGVSGDMRDYLALFCLDLTSGLEYLHNNLVAHLDVKPENLVVQHHYRPRLKIIDFNLAIQVKSKTERVSFIRGTLDYVAPEVLSLKPYLPFKADTFSCGRVLLEFSTRMTGAEGEAVERFGRHFVDLDPVSRPYLSKFREFTPLKDIPASWR
ncbi:hypothetical protein D9757_007520 [Collybiopsis confluens]|uniref:Protein kinase domain-containing protein n=1 Tax=Collybiopsis confluens TaxID=2823264 RepID=A0A8H5M8H1_9AGAR|nr:hypothetical protein D9757_007520 [Collybiopsis confluens]